MQKQRDNYNTDVFRVMAAPMTMQVNINAERNTDGEAPSIKLNNHKPANDDKWFYVSQTFPCFEYGFHKSISSQ